MENRFEYYKQQFLSLELSILLLEHTIGKELKFKRSISKKDRNAWKTMFIGRLEGFSNSYKKGNVSDEEHIGFLKELEIQLNAELWFTPADFRFGMAQLIGNLFLKYMWAIGVIETPPHFPITHFIQNDLQLDKIACWKTDIKDEKEYMNIINKVRKHQVMNNFKNLAEMDLSAAGISDMFGYLPVRGK